MEKRGKLKKWQTYLIHLTLFLCTILTTTLAGAEWMTGRAFFINENNIGWSEWMDWKTFMRGFAFSIPFLGFLTVHEFGHYITARLYKVKVTLPFYIPFWTGITSTIGTVGALIQIRSKLQSRKEFFDIGIAGPLAGFVIAIGVLIYGFTHLPPAEYIFTIHPDWKQYGLDYPKYVYQDAIGALALGKNLLFMLLEYLFVSDVSRMPNPYEVVHYPFLFAGYLGLLFTALNLLPVGQLDGGHILYGLIGYKRHRQVAPILFIAFVFYAGLGVFTPHELSFALSQANSFWDSLETVSWIGFYIFFLTIVFSRITKSFRDILLLSVFVFTLQFVISFFFPTAKGYAGWFAFAFLLGRFLGIYHPPAVEDRPLDWKRQVLGWTSLLIFVLCFSPQPFIFLD